MLQHLQHTPDIHLTYTHVHVIFNNYSLKWRGIVAKYLPSHEVAR